MEVTRDHTITPSQRANLLWEQIKALLLLQMTEIMDAIKTKDGKTQTAGKMMEGFVETALHALGATFEKAGTQQSKDYRNVGGTGLNIEVKKTDNTTVIFNDTCPTKGLKYIVAATCHKTKKYEPNLLFLDGEEFLDGSQEWLEEYRKAIDALKDKYARGDNKKQLPGMMSVYPRPTYRADISTFLTPLADPQNAPAPPHKE